MIQSVDGVGKISFEAPKTDTQLRRGRSWVSQDSQPFVRPTVTFGFHLINILFHFLTLSYCCRRQPQNKNFQATVSKHLILVAGHSVTVSGHLEDAGVDESDW